MVLESYCRLMTVNLRPPQLVHSLMNKVPKNLLREVVTLTSTCRQQTIYLLGTCHVSAKSCADVRLLVSSVQLKAVFLELCQSRREVLDDNFSRDYRQGSKLKDLSFSEIVQKLRSGELNLFTLAYSSILRSISNELNITPGSEFKAAYDCALALPIRAYIVLGDRDVGITMNRLWNGLTAMQKIQLICHVVYQSFSGSSFSGDLEAKIDEFKQDRSKIYDEFNRVLGDKFPWVAEALVNERDVFMMLELHKVLEELGTGDVVAVVGAAHVDGIARQWSLQQSRSREEAADLLKLVQMQVPQDMSLQQLREYASSISHMQHLKNKRDH